MFPNLNNVEQSVVWCSLCASKEAEGDLTIHEITVPVCEVCGHRAQDDPSLEWLSS